MSLRVTNHHGRIGTTTHNGRRFDLDNAPHIDQSRTPQNRYWFLGCTGKPYCGLDHEAFMAAFADSELRYYEEVFGASIKARNERYKAQRHPERCRTVEQVLTAKNHQPVETILQIGDKDAKIDPAVFRACVDEYIGRLQKWSKAHGDTYQLINFADHVDEASCHAHLRGVFQWWDEETGYWELGQEEGLKRAGVELPHPEQKVGRFNNRKMAFDSMLREWWIQIVEEHGFEVEKEPVKGAKHLTVEAYKRKMDAEKALAEHEAQIQAREAELLNRERALDERAAQIAAREAALDEQEEDLKRTKARAKVQLGTALWHMEAAQKAYEEATPGPNDDGPEVHFMKSKKNKATGKTLYDDYRAQRAAEAVKLKGKADEARQAHSAAIEALGEDSQQESADPKYG